MFYINTAISTDTRFDTIKFFNINEDNIDPLNSFFMLNVPVLPLQGTYKITKEELRPELISYKIYNDTQYWWIILLYNNILDINDLKPGLELRYPTRTGIEYLYERASLLQKTT